MFGRLIAKKSVSREEEARRLREKLMNEVMVRIESIGQAHANRGIRLVKELVEASTMRKANVDVLEGYAAGILFASKLVADHTGEEDVGVEAVQTRAATTVGMLYKLIEQTKRPTMPSDHTHGGEPIFRKRSDGTPFCVVCDEDVTEDEASTAKK